MNQRIEVPGLARVEGEGGLYIGVKDGQVDEIRVDIYEPPRFFEGFLRDRYLQEVPDITARICGICPVAYQMSSVYALERAVGYTITPTVRELRRLLIMDVGFVGRIDDPSVAVDGSRSVSQVMTNNQ